MNQVVVDQPWTRSSDGWIAGVCQGFADRFEVNAGFIRLIWLGSILFAGVGFLIYFICAFCLPVEGNEASAQKAKFLGVCLRLSHKTDMDVGLLRILAVVIALGSFGTTILAYIIIHFLLPKQVA